MSRLTLDRHWTQAVVVVGVLTGAAAARAGNLPVILSEDFASNPIGTRASVTTGDATRYSYAPGTLTAGYDSSQATALLVWSLGQTLTQNTSFAYSVTYQVSNLSAPTNSGGQVAFGLINSAATGTSRTGSGYAPPYGDDSYDIVTVDYFPAPSSWPGALYPTLAPTEMNSASADAGGDAFAGMNSVFGPASQLAALLPGGAPVTTTVRYDAGTGQLVEATTDAGANVLSSVNLDLTGAVFAVDSFTIPLWNDGYEDGVYDPALTADLAFSSITVAAAPEPASVVLLAAGGAGLLLRRRSRR
jgi:hypothetical protein